MTSVATLLVGQLVKLRPIAQSAFWSVRTEQGRLPTARAGTILPLLCAHGEQGRLYVMNNRVPTEIEPAEPGTTRRRFYLGIIFALNAIMGAAVAIPAALYLLWPPKLRKHDDWVEAGDIGRLTPKAPLEMIFRQNRTDGWRVSSEKKTAWVVKLPDNKIVAFGPQCTHLGCAYHWEADKAQFFCPCHNSVFAMDGTVVSGPAPRPLDRYDLKIAANKLMLGQLRESTGQLS